MLKYESNLLHLINAVSERRNHGKDTVYVHIKIKKDDAVSLGEIEQVLDFQFGQQDATLYKFPHKNVIVFLINNSARKSLSYFDKAIFENFDLDAVNVASNNLEQGGLELLASLCDNLLPDGDNIPLRVALRRMRRFSNSMLVLDDDLMVLKMMETILSSFGIVGISQTAEKFLELYNEFAPNIIFVDMHLKAERGSDVIKQIRANLDPNVHAILISSDGTKDTVLEVKAAGVKGFIVKPFNRDIVYKTLLKTPTFVQKN